MTYKKSIRAAKLNVFLEFLEKLNLSAMLYYKRKTASLGINNRQCNKSTRNVFFCFVLSLRTLYLGCRNAMKIKDMKLSLTSRNKKVIINISLFVD